MFPIAIVNLQHQKILAVADPGDHHDIWLIPQIALQLSCRSADEHFERRAFWLHAWYMAWGWGGFTVDGGARAKKAVGMQRL